MSNEIFLVKPRSETDENSKAVKLNHDSNLLKAWLKLKNQKGNLRGIAHTFSQLKRILAKADWTDPQDRLIFCKTLERYADKIIAGKGEIPLPPHANYYPYLLKNFPKAASCLTQAQLRDMALSNSTAAEIIFDRGSFWTKVSFLNLQTLSQQYPNSLYFCLVALKGRGNNRNRALASFFTPAIPNFTAAECWHNFEVLSSLKNNQPAINQAAVDALFLLAENEQDKIEKEKKFYQVFNFLLSDKKRIQFIRWQHIAHYNAALPRNRKGRTWMQHFLYEERKDGRRLIDVLREGIRAELQNPQATPQNKALLVSLFGFRDIRRWVDLTGKKKDSPSVKAWLEYSKEGNEYNDDVCKIVARDRKLCPIIQDEYKNENVYIWAAQFAEKKINEKWLWRGAKIDAFVDDIINNYLDKPQKLHADSQDGNNFTAEEKYNALLWYLQSKKKVWEKLQERYVAVNMNYSWYSRHDRNMDEMHLANLKKTMQGIAQTSVIPSAPGASGQDADEGVESINIQSETEDRGSPLAQSAEDSSQVVTPRIDYADEGLEDLITEKSEEARQEVLRRTTTSEAAIELAQVYVPCLNVPAFAIMASVPPQEWAKNIFTQNEKNIGELLLQGLTAQNHEGVALVAGFVLNSMKGHRTLSVDALVNLLNVNKFDQSELLQLTEKTEIQALAIVNHAKMSIGTIDKNTSYFKGLTLSPKAIFDLTDKAKKSSLIKLQDNKQVLIDYLLGQAPISDLEEVLKAIEAGKKLTPESIVKLLALKTLSPDTQETLVSLTDEAKISEVISSASVDVDTIQKNSNYFKKLNIPADQIFSLGDEAKKVELVYLRAFTDKKFSDESCKTKVKENIDLITKVIAKDPDLANIAELEGAVIAAFVAQHITLTDEQLKNIFVSGKFDKYFENKPALILRLLPQSKNFDDKTKERYKPLVTSLFPSNAADASPSVFSEIDKAQVEQLVSLGFKEQVFSDPVLVQKLAQTKYKNDELEIMLRPENAVKFISHPNIKEEMGHHVNDEWLGNLEDKSENVVKQKLVTLFKGKETRGLLPDNIQKPKLKILAFADDATLAAFLDNKAWAPIKRNFVEFLPSLPLDNLSVASKLPIAIVEPAEIQGLALDKVKLQQLLAHNDQKINDWLFEGKMLFSDTYKALLSELDLSKIEIAKKIITLGGDVALIKSLNLDKAKLQQLFAHNDQVINDWVFEFRVCFQEAFNTFLPELDLSKIEMAKKIRILNSNEIALLTSKQLMDLFKHPDVEITQWMFNNEKEKQLSEAEQKEIFNVNPYYAAKFIADELISIETFLLWLTLDAKKEYVLTLLKTHEPALKRYIAAHYHLIAQLSKKPAAEIEAFLKDYAPVQKIASNLEENSEEESSASPLDSPRLSRSAASSDDEGDNDKDDSKVNFNSWIKRAEESVDIKQKQKNFFKAYTRYTVGRYEYPAGTEINAKIGLGTMLVKSCISNKNYKLLAIIFNDKNTTEEFKTKQLGGDNVPYLEPITDQLWNSFYALPANDAFEMLASSRLARLFKGSSEKIKSFDFDELKQYSLSFFENESYRKIFQKYVVKAETRKEIINTMLMKSDTWDKLKNNPALLEWVTNISPEKTKALIAQNVGLQEILRSPNFVEILGEDYFIGKLNNQSDRELIKAAFVYTHMDKLENLRSKYSEVIKKEKKEKREQEAREKLLKEQEQEKQKEEEKKPVLEESKPEAPQPQLRVSESVESNSAASVPVPPPPPAPVITGAVPPPPPPPPPPSVGSADKVSSSKAPSAARVTESLLDQIKLGPGRLRSTKAKDTDVTAASAPSAPKPQTQSVPKAPAIVKPEEKPVQEPMRSEQQVIVPVPPPPPSLTAHAAPPPPPSAGVPTPPSLPPDLFGKSSTAKMMEGLGASSAGGDIFAQINKGGFNLRKTEPKSASSSMPSSAEDGNDMTNILRNKFKGMQLGINGNDENNDDNSGWDEENKDDNVGSPRPSG